MKYILHTLSQPHSLKKFRFRKSDLYRYSRMLHGYLSAFAFLTLIFFALTGLFLNHPRWFKSDKIRIQTVSTRLSTQEIALVLKDSVPSQALLGILNQHTPLIMGILKKDETIDDEKHLHLDGVTGKTDIVVNLKSGSTEITVKKASFMSIIKDLHRGKNSGRVWSLFIDMTSITVLALSLIGYIIFFSIRLRLKLSLTLTAFSVALFMGIFYLFVS